MLGFKISLIVDDVQAELICSIPYQHSCPHTGPTALEAVEIHSSF